METRKTAILAALDAFVRQRPGLEFGNYGDVKTYRAEMRSITRDLHDYRQLERRVMMRDELTADMLLEAARSAYFGRLTISKPCEHQGDKSSKATCGKCGRSWCDDCYPAPSAMCHHCNHYKGAVPAYGAVKIEYCTGQYFPTEYRRAACAVLASALWYHAREHSMGAPLTGEPRTYVYHRPGHKSPDALSAGDWLRSHFRDELGARLAARWFS